MNPSLTRERLDGIRRIREQLETTGYPRLQMLLLVTLTGGAGWLASFTLLHAGLLALGWRYLASFAVAYGVFLLLLWLWLRTRAEDYSQFSDLPGPSGSSEHGHAMAVDGGAHAGGGVPHSSPEGAALPGDALGEAFGAAAQAELLAVPLLLLLAGAVLLGSIAFLVASAPGLLAELLLDATLSLGLYRRLRQLPRSRHWLRTALRRTAWQFALTALLVSGLGWGLGLYAPQAHTLGEVLARHHALAEAARAPAAPR